jgi:hypothetical protein
VVELGIEERVRALVRRIKAHPNYNDTTPGYNDTEPFPATAAKWTYRAMYYVGDSPVGQWSDR